MEKVKLIICDIDSTLTTEEHILTARTFEVIKQIHDQGISFGIASGRSIRQQLIYQAGTWGFPFQFSVIIGMNGCELYDDQKKQYYDYYKLKKAWIKEIIELMQPFDLNPFIYYQGKMMCLKEDSAMRASSARNRTEILIAKDPSQMYQEDNAKIMFRMPEELMPKVEEYLSHYPSPNYRSFKTQTTMLEFANAKVSKAVALKEYCRMNSIDLKDVWAFGDMSNDDEMLMAAGKGVCMLNGNDHTKAIADEITEYTNEEDGFARYIEQHLFKK